MAPDPSAAARAWSALQAGHPAEAARLYQEVLRDAPDNADLWCMLGIAQRASGRPSEAVASYREALRLRPDFVEAWNNLGNALLNQGKITEAQAAFEHVLWLRPGHPEAHNNLAAVLRQQGKWAEAEALYREALRLKPDYADAHNNRGVALQGLGRLEEAEACYREALRLRPAYPEALTNLGGLLTRTGRLDEAEVCHRQALMLRPGYVEARNNLGNTLVERRQYAAAEACYREALRLAPDYADGHHHLGIALAEQGKLDEAVACYREAIRLQPDSAEVRSNLASAQLARGQPDEALAAFDDLLKRKPDAADVHLGRALALLARGDWEEGWKEYEWRWRCEEFGGTAYREPLWDGSSLEGRTILLRAEQGVGDTLLFVRYARLVKQRGGTVLLACPKALLRLLANCPGIDQLIAPGEQPPSFDCHAPLLSLPGVFDTTPERVPAEIPYVLADPGLIVYWGRELADREGLKVGIVWQGNPQYKADRLRSIPLARFAPLARTPGVRLFSLQKGHGSEQLAQVDFPVVDLGSRLDETAGPFMDTAAVLKHLDLVVTADTSMAHLAGALGVPVWLALAYSPHWVWMLQREDTPWYPTMRLFRQRCWGDWDEILERMAGELARRAARRRAGPILIEIGPGELFDRIAALEVQGGSAVRQRLALEAARDQAVPASGEMAALAAELKAVHRALSESEQALKRCQRDGQHGRRLVRLARAVQQHNERRAEIRRRIDDLLGFEGKDEPGN